MTTSLTTIFLKWLVGGHIEFDIKTATIPFHKESTIKFQMAFLSVFPHYFQMSNFQKSYFLTVESLFHNGFPPNLHQFTSSGPQRTSSGPLGNSSKPQYTSRGHLGTSS